MSQRIVLVGHCGIDAPRLERAVSRACPRSEVFTINSEAELEDVCDSGAALLLVNRQLPYGFEEEEGVDLIKDLQRQYPHVRAMLVSDRPDAQADAREAGAVDGFGKADLGSARIAQALQRALAGQRPC